MDRIDLQVRVNRLKPSEIVEETVGEASESVFQRVQAASCNAEMQSSHLREWCKLNDTTRNLLENAIKKLGLSVRGSDRILKVSRTIADLCGDEELNANHVAEAIQYRTIDRMQ
jgi:magnesium chelatase family protein